jgi:hypothetical protein
LLGLVTTLVGVRHAQPFERGEAAFTVISMLLLGYCLFGGVLLTADCLASEKRSGSLGLLWLTDLRPYDVVLGKLAGTSLNVFFGLLATLPILALPLLMGGVTGVEFGRVVLLLVTTLVWSLNVGLLVSAFSWDGRHAITTTMLVILVATGVLPVIWMTVKFLLGKDLVALLLLSPVFTFRQAFSAHYTLRPGVFWASVGYLGLSAFLCGWAACLALPRNWQEQRSRQQNAILNQGRLANHVNPYLHLVRRDKGAARLLRWAIWTAWVFFLVLLLTSVMTRYYKESFISCMAIAYLLHFLAKLLLAMDCSRRFLEERRNGAMELLLATPLRPAQMIIGNLQGSWQAYKGALGHLAVMNLILLLAVHLFHGRLHMSGSDQKVFSVLFVGGCVILFADALALSWTAMWQGMVARSQSRALLAVLGRIYALPIGLMLMTHLLLGVTLKSPHRAVTFLCVWFLIGFVVDLLVGEHARRRLQWHFRAMAAGERTAWSGP